MSDIPMSVIEDFLREHRLIAHMRISENAVCILERSRFSGNMQWLGEGPTLVHAFANARAKFLAWRK